MMRRTAALAVTAAVALVAVPATAGAHSDSARASKHGKLDRQLKRAKKATARFRSVATARRAGYAIPSVVPSEACVAGPAGAMGFHAVHLGLIRDDAVRVKHPEILLYEPRGKTLKLVGIEYIKADADQDLSTDDDRPSLFGVPFDGPMEGHEPGMPVHYDLHVWVHKRNPLGTFAMFNPRVHCPS